MKSPQTKSRLHRLRPLLYLLLAGFVFWCFQHLQNDLNTLPVIQWPLFTQAILLCGALSLLNYALRIVRWHLFMSRLGYGLTWARSTLYYLAGFAFTLSPGKVGELARVRYYQSHGVPGATVTAAFFVERLLDLLVILAMCLLILTQTLESEHYQTLLWLTSMLLVGITLSLALLPWEKIELRFSQRYPLVQKITHTLTQAKGLLKPNLLVIGIVLSLIAWGSEGIGLAFLLSPIEGHAISTQTAAGIYAIAVLAGALSFLPGGLGGTEAVMITLLHQHGISLGESVLVTLLCRLLTLWLAVLLGWLAIFALRCWPKHAAPHFTPHTSV